MSAEAAPTCRPTASAACAYCGAERNRLRQGLRRGPIATRASGVVQPSFNSRLRFSPTRF